MPVHICATCAAHFPEAEAPPAECPICVDERQYVAPGGQAWTTREQLLESGHRNVFTQLEGGVTAITVEPKLAIGQRCFLLETPGGAVLWDCLGFLHPDAVAEIKERFGGIVAIAISHPHFYTAMVDWAEAFNCRVYVSKVDKQWITQPSDRIELWSGDELELVPGCKVVRLGGHFPGSCVLHWDKAPADSKGLLFTGDTILPTMDSRWTTFMWSFPNFVPLPAKEVRRIAAAIAPYPFDRLYGGLPFQPVVGPDASGAVQRSAKRYIGMEEGTLHVQCT